MGLAGIPLCVVVSPLLWGLILVGAHLVDLAAPLPQARWDRLHDVAFALPNLWALAWGRPAAVSWSTLALLYAAPGALLMLIAWPFVKLLSRTAGAGMMLRRLASREPDPTVPSEQQLRNVVQEMAIAAGVRAPAVRIIESAAANAVAIGLTTEDAAILVTTGLLERLDRDERQAIVAHLVGSVGNGDLEIAANILSVFQTWGLVALALETPLDASRRALVRRFGRLSLDAARGRVDPEEARGLLDGLLGGGAFEFEEFFANLETINPRSVAHGCCIILVQIPLIATVGLAAIAAKQAIALFTALVLGPWLAAMWRARRRLADATAVQLTRNPEALARAIRDLEAGDVEVPGGWVVNFLFPVWPPITERSAAPDRGRGARGRNAGGSRASAPAAGRAGRGDGGGGGRCSPRTPGPHPGRGAGLEGAGRGGRLGPGRGPPFRRPHRRHPRGRLGAVDRPLVPAPVGDGTGPLAEASVGWWLNRRASPWGDPPRGRGRQSLLTTIALWAATRFFKTLPGPGPCRPRKTGESLETTRPASGGLRLVRFLRPPKPRPSPAVGAGCPQPFRQRWPQPGAAPCFSSRSDPARRSCFVR